MNAQTLSKMKQMKLHGMANAFESSVETGKWEKYTADELLSLLVESEWDERHNRKFNLRLKEADFRYKASIEELSFDAGRNLDKNQIMRLADCEFIKRKEIVLVTGSTGGGKSYLASALGNHACEMGLKVLYRPTSKLFSKLKQAKADGSYAREMKRIEKADLLIIDDFGIQPLDTHSRMFMMEIMEDRHGKSSTIITSQVPVSGWYEIIGEQTIADAILDRIIHDAHRIELKGESLRKKRGKEKPEMEELN
jgi:DNA replication protein DnaC